jgi:hypothetical protein
MTAGPLFTPNPIRTLLSAAITIPVFSCQDQIVATPGGGQTAAFQLEGTFNRITIVGSAGDSVALSSAQTGSFQLIINAGAQTLDIYPNGTDTLDNNGPGVAETLAAGSWIWFYCLAQGQWRSTVPGSGGVGITAPVIFPGRVVTAAGTIAVTNADYYVGVDKLVGAPTSVTLPRNPFPFQQVVIDDAKGDAATNPITIEQGATPIYVLNINGSNVTLLWTGISWRPVA